eukprot:gb/GFBE01083001.1/.p1 GENE.gb/GFBE01083001.1/~~gb/GFBE01083001.1/.p1  ORF type:complete len:475 (+),score=118.47 gb/GFBE01083001.1/:1-1425(+)
MNCFAWCGGGSGGGDKKPKIKLPVSPGKVPVFVMLQLDWISEDGQTLRFKDELRSQLAAAKTAGLKGVMADVWWGVCEPQPGVYNFGAAKELCELLSSLGMNLQAVMSFHQCGGNVGDTVSFPLPAWCLQVAKSNGFLYRSKAGVVSEDCLSLSADHARAFPAPGGGQRTALQCYQDYMTAFVKAMGSHFGTTICELQVGMGPCGELRYPSYLMSNGWNWPGVGIVMAYDPGMLARLKAETGLTEPPPGLPEDQNAMPEAIPIFKAGENPGFRNGSGKVFLEWYSSVLIRHGQEVLAQATTALQKAGAVLPGKSLCFSVKVSGLHWHVMHQSRATEACAGYNCCTSDSADAYASIARMLSAAQKQAQRPVLFNFTCMEMANNSNGGVPHSLSAPEDLIGQVRLACVSNNVGLAGENALEFDLATGNWAFDQMEKQIRSFSPGTDAMHGITLLRLGPNFVRPEALEQLAQFATKI